MSKYEHLPRGDLLPRDVIWDPANLQHVIYDHAERKLSVAEVEEAMVDPARLDIEDPDRGSLTSIGATQGGRLLFVACIRRPEGLYPIHARDAGKRKRKDYDEAKDKSGN